jgi:hypothetical protein
MPPPPDPAFWLDKRSLTSLVLPASHTFATRPDGWEIGFTAAGTVSVIVRCGHRAGGPSSRNGQPAEVSREGEEPVSVSASHARDRIIDYCRDSLSVTEASDDVLSGAPGYRNTMAVLHPRTVGAHVVGERRHLEPLVEQDTATARRLGGLGLEVAQCWPSGVDSRGQPDSGDAWTQMSGAIGPNVQRSGVSGAAALRQATASAAPAASSGTRVS